MTNVCVVFTAQGASLPAGSTSVTARQIHDGAGATITDRCGIVVPSLAGLKECHARRVLARVKVIDREV
jgi:hypothetical protein